MRPSASPKIGARARLTINLIGAGLWASGGFWLIFHYFLRRPGEWGPEPHVLEPYWLGLHGAFAFVALTTIGLVWGVHIVKAWPTRRRRWSGPVLFAWLLALSITGYLLLYVGDDGVWALLSPAHWIAGLALPAIYGAHRLIRAIRRRKQDVI